MTLVTVALTSTGVAEAEACSPATGQGGSAPGPLGQELVTVSAEASAQGADLTLEAIARDVGPLAYRVALRMLGDPAAAEDALHDAFLQAQRGLGAFRGEASVKTWFMRILVNSCRRHRRLWRRWVLGTEVERAQAAEVARDVYGDPALRAQIERAILRLPHRQRTAFVLRYSQELSVDEIAGVMGCAVGTVKATLFKAVRKLRVELADLADPE